MRIITIIGILVLLSGCTTKPIPLVSQPTGQTTPLRPDSAEATTGQQGYEGQADDRSQATVAPTPIRQMVDPSPKPIDFKIISLPSTFHSDATRDLKTVDTIVIHSVYNPNTSDHFAIANIKKVFDDEEVSSHFVITRDGNIYQLVPEEYQAWHAGVSKMPNPDNREKVNLFSIGIELVGNETSEFTAQQYTSLQSLITLESKKLSIKWLTGHIDIAPGRKTDPWKFEWSKISGNFQVLH